MNHNSGRSCPDCASRGSASTSRAVGKKKKGPQTAESSNDGSPERFPRAPRLRVGRGLASLGAALDPVAPAQARPSPILSEAQSTLYVSDRTLFIHVSIVSSGIKLGLSWRENAMRLISRVLVGALVVWLDAVGGAEELLIRI